MKFKSQKSIFLTLVFSMAAYAVAQTTELYFIGNSYTYTYDVPGTLSDLAAAGGHTLQIDSDLIGGAELIDHWATGEATNDIANGSYDIVIVQENSALSYTPSIQSNFNIYAPLYDGVITNSGAQTLLYMTFLRESKLSSLQDCIDIYRNMADQLGCGVSPVGEAWKRLLVQYPSIDPYGPDRHHQSPFGSYLAACCFYGTIYGESPEGLGVNSAGGIAIDKTDAAVLERIAWDAVQFVSFTNPPVITSLSVDQTVHTNTDAFVFQIETSGSEVVDVAWDFGDGTITNGLGLMTVAHVYTEDGPYPVTVTVTALNGETDRSGIRVLRDVLGPQVEAFSASPTSGETPLTVFFTDNSTGNITNRFWDFGDGTVTNTAEASVSHIYTAAGTWTVQLVVSGPAGTDSNTQTNVISVAYSPTRIAAADLADRYIIETDPLTYANTSYVSGRVGDSYADQRYTYVIPFALPDLANGDPVSEVKLKLYISSKGAYSSATNVYVDILGGRVDPSPTVTGEDATNTTAVLLDNAQIINKFVTVPVEVVYNLDPSFFQVIYDSDPDAVGKFVFITLRVDNIDPSGSNSYLNYGTANASSNTPTLTIISAPATNADTDNDGLPDSWEKRYFGGVTNANPAAAASNGINSLLEAYIVGLNPTNASARFAVSNGWDALKWNAVSGRVYSVWWTTNLLESFQCLESNVLWPQNSWTDAVNTADNEAFYKIEVQLAH